MTTALIVTYYFTIVHKKRGQKAFYIREKTVKNSKNFVKTVKNGGKIALGWDRTARVSYLILRHFDSVDIFKNYC